MATEPVRVTVKVLKGRQLAPKDKNGLSDPFVEVFVERNGKVMGTKQKTDVVDKNLNPEWKSGTFELQITSTDSLIRLQVFDKDILGSDFMGEATVDVPTLQSLSDSGAETWLPLQPRQGKKDVVSGDILVQFHIHTDSPAEEKKATPSVQPTAISPPVEPKQTVQAQSPPAQQQQQQQQQHQPSSTLGRKPSLESKVLSVTVVGAKELPGLDSGGTSDPYCVLELLDTKSRSIKALKRETKVVRKTVAPEWNETFSFDPTEEVSAFQITVWDKNQVAFDKIIGRMKLSVAELLRANGTDEWYQLLPDEGEKKPVKPGSLGYVFLRIFIAQGVTLDLENLPLFLNVVKGRNLVAKDANGTSDPFATVMLLDGEGKEIKDTKKTTKTISKTLNPEWREQFKFTSQNVSKLQVDVWDHDLMGSNDFVGQCVILASELQQGDGELKWFKLNPRHGNPEDIGISGEIALQFQQGRAPILPPEDPKPPKEEKQRKIAPEEKKQAVDATSQAEQSLRSELQSLQQRFNQTSQHLESYKAANLKLESDLIQLKSQDQSDPKQSSQKLASPTEQSTSAPILYLIAGIAIGAIAAAITVKALNRSA